MSSRALWPLVAGALAWVGACAPSVPALIEHGQYTEALCAVQAFDMPEHREALTQSLRQALDPALHVHGVTRHELAGLVGDEAPRLLERAVVLRTRHDSRRVDLERFELVAALSSPGAEVEPLPLTLETLAELTRERLPQPVEHHYGPSRLRQAADTAQNLGAVGADLLETITLGTVPFTKLIPAAPHRPSGTRTIAPTAEELAQAAPSAALIQEALETTDHQGRPGATHDSFAVWRRPAQGTPVTLTVVARYSGYSPEGDCELIDGVAVALPADRSVEEGLRALFAGRMRRLSELRQAGEP